ncbi:MAG: HAMP domain-containing histidine kinase, partial [Anaerolineales bacterium]|nr:HAMP domain-containing histidine kinase [Anaerolineales bacterium]
PTYSPKSIFLLLAIFAAVAQFATTSVPVSETAGITFEVGTAVAMAAIPFFGPAAAAAIVAFSSLSIWMAKSRNEVTWKKSWRQLSFNTGMWSIAIFGAGEFYTYLNGYLYDSHLIVQMLLWAVTAMVNTQLNFWLLVVMLRLQHGPQVKPLKLWQENSWATLIDFLIKNIGGGFLIFATKTYGWIAIAAFFLPILLSAIAFRLYVRQMQNHMNNLESIITERTQELSDLMREKDAFLAVFSHDMKTPLTTIGLYADLLMEFPNIIQTKPHIPEILQTNQRALTNMVNDILDLEKLQIDATFDLVKEPFDLLPALESVTESMSVQAERKGISLSQNFNTHAAYISGDAQQIQRAFQNLLSNAIKYTPENGQVVVEVQVAEEAVNIAVKDTGYGIPKEDLPFVFDRFRRVKKHERMAGGTGLGLAIVKAIVEAHDGRISVTSREGQGSRFLVSLPLELAAVPA